MQLGDLVLIVSVLVTMPVLVYIGKHPQAKGEPIDRTHKLLMIPLLLALCGVIIAAFLMSARR